LMKRLAGRQIRFLNALDKRRHFSGTGR
jgi:hypothetical protein